MKQFPQIYLTVFAVLILSALSAATDIYFAPTATGSNNGSSCSNAYAYSDSSHGWNSTTNYSPGNKLHICSGTYVGGANGTILTTAGNGTSGSPISILADQGPVIFQSSYFSGTNGAISSSNNYITLCGVSSGSCQTSAPTNLTIENTLSGTSGGACLGGSCNQQQPTMCINFTGSNVIIENLTCTHVYVHTEGVNDGAGDDSAGIHVSGSNSQVLYTDIDNAFTAVGSAASGISNIEFGWNTVTLCNHCLKIPINSGTVTGVKIHDNDISDSYVWDEPDNHYHHNGIFTFGDPSGTITGDYYNNYFHGTFSRTGSHTTAYVFLEYDNANSRLFNNVIAPSASDLGPDNGDFTLGGSSGPQSVYNNTFYHPSGSGHNECIRGGNNNLTFSNNIMQNCGIGVDWSGTGTVAGDYNIYFQLNGTWVDNNGWITFSQWQSDCKCDSHSTTSTDPKLNASTLLLQSGSPAIGFGTNLTNLAISALDVDKAGVARPSSGNWSDGAYQGSGGGASLNPPTGLVGTVQ